MVTRLIASSPVIFVDSALNLWMFNSSCFWPSVKFTLLKRLLVQRPPTINNFDRRPYLELLSEAFDLLFDAGT
jgi:hypothetical protein